MNILEKITHAIQEHTNNPAPSIIIGSEQIPIEKERFDPIVTSKEEKTIVFIDGGEAELLKTPSFSLFFIRAVAATFKGTKKDTSKTEFYLLTTASPRAQNSDMHNRNNADLNYKTTIFQVAGNPPREHEFSSVDTTIQTGNERIDISKISNVMRRFAELHLAAICAKTADFVIIDGLLEPSFTFEKEYSNELPKNVSSITKTNQLFTVSGHCAAALFHEHGPQYPWSYKISDTPPKSYCVKLHEKSNHIFRFQGATDVLPHILAQCTDPIFMGYPYGLIWADGQARVSNKEATMRKAQLIFKMKATFAKIKPHLAATNAHEILDNMM